jgi:inner membrane protein
MQKILLLKLFTIGVLTLILLIPLSMIREVIGARQQRQFDVEHTVAASSAGAQVLAGPVLVVPYAEKVVTRKLDGKGLETAVVSSVSRLALFMPETLNVEGTAGVEAKYKGLYKALVFENKGTWRARFNVPANFGLDADPQMIRAGRAYLAFGVSDVRGIIGQPRLSWGASPLAVAQGTRLASFPQGIHAEIGTLDGGHGQIYEAALELSVIGTGTLSYAPIGSAMTVRLKSPWPHPNFTGRFLPREKSITGDGFSARWETTQFGTASNELVRRGAVLEAPGAPRAAQPGAFDTFGTTFIEPVNIYLQAERAVKYGILFVALTFAGFFLLETLKQLRIHPLQYGLVGLALAVFFLLVISLSEHLAFAWAYLIAATACIALLGYYLSDVLKSRLRGFAFAAMFTLLYGVLYGLLLSEDNALVMGSLVLFAALAAIMVLTRKVDWYELRTDS